MAVNNKKNFSEFKLRFTLILVFIFAFLLSFIYKLYILQIKNYKFWLSKAKQEKIKKVKYFLPRGTIKDKFGRDLAISIKVYSVFADPALVDNPKTEAAILSDILKIEEKKLYKKLTKPKTRFVWIKRAIDEETFKKIKKLKLTGIFFKKEYKRVYPYGLIGRQIIGNVGLDENNFLDNKGLFGIERYYNKFLKGITYINKKPNFNLKNSCNLILNIDIKVQFFIEELLKEIEEKYHPKNSYFLVFDLDEKKLIAAASLPLPKNDTDIKGMNPGFITKIYEPGSVIKPLIISKALEEKTVSPLDKFYCAGFIYLIPGKYKIKCTAEHKWIKLDEIIKYSCNVGSIKVALTLGKEKLFDLLKQLGFGQKTGIDLPGEISGILRPLKKWSIVSIGSIAIGQEIAVTSIQMFRSLLSIFNFGFEPTFKILNKIIAPSGKILYEFNPSSNEVKIFSKPEVLNFTQNAMKEVVKAGTARYIYTDKYEIFGKTGTSQKATNKGYEKGKYIVSFFSVAKFKNKKIAAYLIIDEPKAKHVSGGRTAAPFVRKLFDKLSNYYTSNIEKLTAKFTSKNKKLEKQNYIKTNLMPDLTGLYLWEVIDKLSGKKIFLKVLGNPGGKVVDFSPKAHQKINKTVEVWLK